MNGKNMNRFLKKSGLASIAVALFAVTAPAAALSKTLNFSGRVWTVRSGGYGSPGTGTWSENNAFVDAQGMLHLKMTYVGGKWYSAEVVSAQSFGMGTYQFYVIGRVDQLDRNVVLGLFSYPTASQGVSGTHEIDIEFARWGNAQGKMLNYSVWPTQKALGPSGNAYPLALNGTWTTHRWIRTPSSVRFQSVHGHYDGNPMPIADWTFRPTDIRRLSQYAMPIHINLWAIAPPSDGRPVEVIIRAFKYTS